MTDDFMQTQREWLSRVALAESMIPLIGNLYREHNVVTSIHGRRLINLSAIEVIKAHRYARRINDIELELEKTLPILTAMQTLELTTASIDLGQLATRFDERGGDLLEFLQTELADVIGISPEDSGADVVLYGFGRIGRLLARILIAHAGAGKGLRLRAIVVRKGSDDDLEKRASLLRRDSVHGPFAGTITVDTTNNTILANGSLIQVIYSNDPAAVDYEAYGIRNAIVIDNTGRWRDEAGLSQHLKSNGVSRVLLTAPGKGGLPNIVHGINHEDITDEHRVVSAASCTTNAITPVLKVLDDKFGVEHGHVETVHSFTNDQNLIDNFHKGARRGRAAGLNMVLTETGAAKAVAKALPSFAGKLTGNAIRVPTPDVSMAVLNLRLERAATREEVNVYLRQVALNSNLRQQIDYIESGEVVSSDFVGTTRAGIVDGLATIADGTNLVVYVWYDNEFGYSSQVVRIAEHLANVHPAVVPTRKEISEL
ncbi:glyceraldehyde-3-phosphate dehydrogenase [Pseudoclavibacter endophyticus]|uniref:Glyceraldehyde-3-phosphate dehydrogenase n=1 Tax=Pseudoclavibacter endophyticus TaxID=1778590 RepID=A0A6H9WUN7_9MICO|nr:glyceraldehyde-3-phosphate dehydrogenase [Pseudoclavibacter endophyticus]KAB1650405.1 glyceraldehyde-3-phosphate dehydrogenase [Pseudoclavibacter endophyticus]GGA54423.1 glyceraldehyde-3-phosphate dehydrogenase [Pseudoclavibacter endophyticus]